MPNSYATEAANGVVAAAYPNTKDFRPHVGLHLSHLSGPNDNPVVLVARLDPDDARSLAQALADSADRVAPEYETYLAEIQSSGGLGE